MERFLSAGAVTSAALRSTSMRRIAPSGPLPMRAVRSTPRIDASCRAAGDAPHAAARAAFHDHPRSWRQRNARRRNNRGSNRSSTLCRPRHCRAALGRNSRREPISASGVPTGTLAPTSTSICSTRPGSENFDLDRTLLCLPNGDEYRLASHGLQASPSIRPECPPPWGRRARGCRRSRYGTASSTTIKSGGGQTPPFRCRRALRFFDRI